MPAYSFLDRSTWPSVGRLREFWEGWFSQYPQSKQRALAARIKSLDNHFHLSAVHELLMFAILRQLGYELEVEPPVGDRALEFLASGNDARFYVECTVTGSASPGRDALEADVLEAIDKLAPGRFLLSTQVHQQGQSALSGKRLRAALQAWLDSLHPDQELDDDLPNFTWESEGWSIAVRAMPTVEDVSDLDGSLGMTISTATERIEAERMRAALDSKASKYGELDLPLLITVGSTEFQREDDLITALLGDPLVHLSRRTGEISSSRKPNGVLYGYRGPRNVAMSAVMHLRCGALNFASREQPPTLTHHPFAAKPLPRGLFPFCLEQFWDDGGELVSVPASVTVAEFLGLPNGWPHFDHDPHHF